MSKPFPWRPGMLDATSGLRWAQGGDHPCVVERRVRRGEAQPDPNDGPTKGALLEVVREIHHSLQSTEYVGDADPVQPWRWGSFRGATEFAALEAAWLAAP